MNKTNDHTIKISSTTHKKIMQIKKRSGSSIKFIIDRAVCFFIKNGEIK